MPIAAAYAVQFTVPGSVAAVYTPQLGAPVNLRAIRTSDPAGKIADLGGNPLAGVEFEIPHSFLPARPELGATLVEESGESWRIRGATDMEYVPGWRVIVERSA
jgi:hypothetical protein